MKHQFLSLAAILSLLLISCQKEISTELPQRNNGTNSADSTYLSKIYLVDSSAAGEDTADVWTWFYDSQKRVIKVTDTTNISGGGTNRISESYEYYYNGADTLPYKSVMIVYSTFGDTAIRWHSFSPDGKKLKDSTWYHFPGDPSLPVPPFTTVTTYSYAPSKIYGTTLSDNAVFVSGITSYDTATLDINGNIIKNKKYTRDRITGDFHLTVSSSMLYDNHPSPFAKLSNFKAHTVFPYGETLIYVSYDFIQNNNILSIEEKDENGMITYSEDFTGMFSYRPDGYPSNIRMTDPAAPGATSKIVYKYRSF